MHAFPRTSALIETESDNEFGMTFCDKIHKTTSVLHCACTPIYESKRIVSRNLDICPMAPPWKFSGPFFDPGWTRAKTFIPKHLTGYPPTTDFHDSSVVHLERIYNWICAARLAQVQIHVKWRNEDSKWTWLSHGHYFHTHLVKRYLVNGHVNTLRLPQEQFNAIWSVHSI